MGTSAAKRQAWIDHVAAWVASGQTQRAYCVARALSYHAFDYWRRFVLKQDAPSTLPATFIPVVALAPPAPACSGVIEVRLVGGARLVWTDGRALSELAQLLHLLAALSRSGTGGWRRCRSICAAAIDRLSASVLEASVAGLTPHTAYLFCNRSGTRLRVLVSGGLGFWLCARRLERGRFVLQSPCPRR